MLKQYGVRVGGELVVVCGHLDHAITWLCHVVTLIGNYQSSMFSGSVPCYVLNE